MLWAGNNRCPRLGTGLEHLRRIETTLAGTQKMRFHLQPTVGEHRGGPSQLQWRDHPEALPDAGDDGFTRKPHLVAGGAFPLRRRQYAGGFSHEVDAGGFAETEACHVGAEAIDAQIHRQLEEIGIDRLRHRLGEIDVSVPAAPPVAVLALVAGQAERT